MEDPTNRVFHSRGEPSRVGPGGAEKAIVHSGASILPVGVTAVVGTFSAGTLISVNNEHGEEIARGLTRLSSEDIQTAMGDKGDPVIHRDDMVTTTER